MAELSHVGLTVSDLERSAAFYREVIGLEEVDRREFRSEAFGRLTHNPGAALKTALLRAQDFVLQLVEYLEGGGAPVAIGHERPGSPHLSFSVDDAARRYRELSARGDVRITSQLIEIIPGLHSFYLADPDGVPVELIERTRWPGQRNP